MSRTASESAEAVARRVFDPVAAPWFFPLLALAALLLARLGAPRLAEAPELLSLDLALRYRAEAGFSEPLDPRIRFVELTMDKELARRFATEGEYATVASLLRTLASLDVRVIAVDIIHAYGRLEDQRVLAEAIREIVDGGSTRVVLAASIERRGEGAELLRPLPLAGGERFPQGIVNAPAARHWREYQWVYRLGEETLPSFALAAYAASRPGALAPRTVGPGAMEWTVLGAEGEAETQRGDGSRIFLNLRHSYFDDRYDRRVPDLGGRNWSIAEVERAATRDAGASPLKDAIVFLGFDEETDGKPTTHGPTEPGMLLHGTALHDLVHGTEIRPVSRRADLAIHLAVAALAALAFSTVRRKRWLVIASAAGIGVILAAGWVSVWFLHLLPASVSPALLWGGAALLEVGRRWTMEQRERTRRDAMLGFYFSPAVLKQVMQNLDMIRPRGGEVAVLLSDLRGFTNLCERGEVERVFELLNRLFAVETEAALREDGSLARFAGDQFLAYWGAPEPCGDAADRALRAALEIEGSLRARREGPEADEIDGWLRIGIGLHFGRGLVGHVGSRSYRDYNIVGDSVNTTARIESQTKNYAAAILASGEFVAALSRPPLALLLDRVQVKGKSRATELHAIFGEGIDPGEATREGYAAAFRLYEGGTFAEAAEAFAALAQDPHATVATSASLLGARCRGFAEAPPADWAGVFELTSK